MDHDAGDLATWGCGIFHPIKDEAAITPERQPFQVTIKSERNPVINEVRLPGLQNTAGNLNWLIYQFARPATTDKQFTALAISAN